MPSFKPYLRLMRVDKPIGILLLLWPTLWALWLATNGHPDFKIVTVFILGVVVMRSAGCVINDFADRHWDGLVTRTQDRPLTTGQINSRYAIVLFLILCLIGFTLVLFLNVLTIKLAFIAVAITILYPYLKRFTHLPQLGLGLAFAWGVPMAFAATTNQLPPQTWLVFFAAALWPVIYDTQYALVDRSDDIKVGIKSTAILWGSRTSWIIASLQILFVWQLIWIGIMFGLTWSYFLAVFFATILCYYQLSLIKNSDRDKCFKAFTNNHWVGMIIFLGICFNSN